MSNSQKENKDVGDGWGGLGRWAKVNPISTKGADCASLLLLAHPALGIASFVTAVKMQVYENKKAPSELVRTHCVLQ